MGKRKTSYRAQIVVKSGGKIAHRESRSFDRRRDAVSWGSKRDKVLKLALAEGPEDFTAAIEPSPNSSAQPTLGALIELYEAAYAGGFGRTVSKDLDLLRRSKLAQKIAASITSADIVDHVRLRRDGIPGPDDLWITKPVGPATAATDLIRLQSVFDAAWASFKVKIPLQELQMARIECNRRKLVGKAKERERVATDEELARLCAHFDSSDRAAIPMSDVVRFALYSCRRQDEITQLRWADNDAEKLTGIVPRLKDPRGSRINVPFRYTQEAWDIAERQPKTDGRIFPYNAKSISAAFTRSCKVLGIDDLRFHDLRHTAVTRLFMLGYQVHEVPAFSLHRTWAALRRYTNIKPEEVALR